MSYTSHHWPSKVQCHDLRHHATKKALGHSQVAVLGYSCALNGLGTLLFSFLDQPDAFFSFYQTLLDELLDILPSSFVGTGRFILRSVPQTARFARSNRRGAEKTVTPSSRGRTRSNRRLLFSSKVETFGSVKERSTG